MPTGVIAAILAAAIIVLLVLGRPAVRGKKLRQRFGPEYDRVLAEQGSRRKAEAELASRERRVRDLDIQPLTEAARASYLTRWASTQERFVDEPDAAVQAARQLVSQAIVDRGYPAQTHAQTLADLSVDHACALVHYREACALSETTANGTAADGTVEDAVSTEDLRQALINYREMFDELVGEQSTTATPALLPGAGPAVAIPAPVGAAIDDDDAETMTTQEGSAR